MPRYQVERPVTLYGGELNLTDVQAVARSHCLRKVKKGLYEIISPVQFKVGEVIGIPGQPDKQLQQSLYLLDQAPPPPPAGTGADAGADTTATADAGTADAGAGDQAATGGGDHGS